MIWILRWYKRCVSGDKMDQNSFLHCLQLNAPCTGLWRGDHQERMRRCFRLFLSTATQSLLDFTLVKEMCKWWLVERLHVQIARNMKMTCRLKTLNSWWNIGPRQHTSYVSGFGFCSLCPFHVPISYRLHSYLLQFFGTIDFCHFIPLSLTLTLPGPHKVSIKQNVVASFSLSLFNWSG